MTASQSRAVSVTILYPTDPLAIMPGGIDTFIRGQLKYCPPDIHYSVVGMSADTGRRPIGRWHDLEIGSRSFRFLPIIGRSGARGSKFLPATIRYTFALKRYGKTATTSAQVLDFHRIEPLLLFGSDTRAKTLVLHQHMSDLRRKGGDIAWRHMPGLYFALERYLLPRADRIFCVREDAVTDYRTRFSGLRERITFSPTWADPDLFFPAKEPQCAADRRKFLEEFGWPEDSKIITTVGRLDGQKNPVLLLDSFCRMAERDNTLRLLFIGDGPLRKGLEDLSRRSGYQDRVRIAGILPPEQVATALRVSDLFAMSSRYEGMPMAVAESLACGIPVVATPVGEIRRLVDPGVCGELAEDLTEQAFHDALARGLDNMHRYRGEPCVTAASPFTPQKVLEPVFSHYRHQASHLAED